MHVGLSTGSRLVLFTCSKAALTLMTGLGYLVLVSSMPSSSTTSSKLAYLVYFTNGIKYINHSRSVVGMILSEAYRPMETTTLLRIFLKFH